MSIETLWSGRWINFAWAVLGTCVFAVTVYVAAWVLIRVVWPIVRTPEALSSLTLIGTGFIFMTGAGLHLFKTYYQRLYGLAEIGFALAVAWASIMRVQSAGDATSWLATVAGAYLIGRGLGNYAEGKKQDIERQRRIRDPLFRRNFGLPPIKGVPTPENKH
jgi:hypothetical protein